MPDSPEQPVERRLACRTCFYAASDPLDRDCQLCARNPSSAEVARALVCTTVFFATLLLARLMILGEVVPGGLAPAAPAWNPFAFPVDLAYFPWHAATLGLFGALLVALPLVAAVLFGPAWGAGLAALAWLVGPFPWVGLYGVAAACVIGLSVRPSRHPIGRTALAAVIGVGVLALRLWPARADVERLGWIARLPVWVAFLVAVFIVIAVLAAASRRHWRAGGLVFAVIAGAVGLVTLFSISVGYEKVAGRLVYEGYAPDSRHFDLRVSPEAVRAPDAFSPDRASDSRRIVRALAVSAYAEHLKRRASHAFADVARRFKESAVAPVCLFNIVRVSRLALDVESLVRDGDARFITAAPDAEAVIACSHINTRYGASPVSALAYLVSAESALRKGAFSQVDQLCTRLLNVFTRQVPKNYVPPANASMDEVFDAFAVRGAFLPDEVTFLYDHAVRRANRLRELVRENADYDSEPLRIFCSVGPQDDTYEETIDALLSNSAYAHARLRDNLRLAKVVYAGGRDVRELGAILDEYPAGDVVDEVLHLLVECHARAGASAANVEKRRHYLQVLVNGYPESVRYPAAFDALKRESGGE